MILRNERLLSEFRQRPCEVCYRCPNYGRRSEAHHILKRGTGSHKRLDVRIGLLSACIDSHAKIEAASRQFNGQVLRVEEQLEIVAHREGISLDVDLLSCLYWLARLPKDSTPERMRAALSELGTAEAGIAWAMLVESGKVKTEAA